MKIARLVVCLLVVLVVANMKQPVKAQGSFDSYEQQAINHINAYRATKGCGPLSHAPEYQAGVEAWVLKSTYPGQHRTPTPAGEIIAYVTDYAPQDEGAYEALHSFWKTSFEHNERLVNCSKYPFTRIAIAHAKRTFPGYNPSTAWLWVAELVPGGSNPPPPANPLPVISQEGRIIMNDLSPPVGGTVRFEVTLKNNSNFPAEFREIFLRINHVATGVERKVDVWHGQQGILVIPANSTWTFRVFSPPIDMLGAWRLHNIEMLHHPTGTWLQGIRNNDYFFAGLTNVARGKTVHVHSVRAGSGNNPQHLVDGNHATRYESAWYDDQIVEIDLGATHKIGYIVMYWEAAYAQKFRVHVNSNDCGSNKHACTWSRVYATGVGENRTYLLTFPQQNVRWIKIWLEKRATPWGFSLWEVTAY